MKSVIIIHYKSYIFNNILKEGNHVRILSYLRKFLIIFQTIIIIWEIKLI